MFYGVIHEGYVFDSKDIKYQVEEFEQGKVKTLFITGLVGSGKSTLGRKYKEQFKIPLYQLDDIGWNDKYSDDQLKNEYPDMYNFLTGPGKKYRIIDGKINGVEVNSENFNDSEACGNFIKYILSKNPRCIVEGIQIFVAVADKQIDINSFEKSALFIKGTSGAKAVYRGTKRDIELDKEYPIYNNGPLKGKNLFKHVLTQIKFMLQDEKSLKELRNRYKNKNR